MHAVQVVLDAIVGLLGGTVTIAFLVSAVLLSIYALLSVFSENRVFYHKVCKGIGVLIGSLALLLPFRQIGAYPMLLAFWFVVQLWSILPIYKTIQCVLCTVLSLIYWLFQSNDLSFFEICGDFVVFVIVPFVFSVVQCSKTTSTLLGGSNEKLVGPILPLESWLNKLGSIIKSVVP